MANENIIPSCGAVYMDVSGNNILITQTESYDTKTLTIPAVMLGLFLAGLNKKHVEWLEKQPK